LLGIFTRVVFNIYKSLAGTEQIRILIGISTDKRTFDLEPIRK